MIGPKKWEMLQSSPDEGLQKFQSLEQLSTCGHNLLEFEKAKSERESFDLRILITDGLDMYNEEPLVLQGLLECDLKAVGAKVSEVRLRP